MVSSYFCSSLIELENYFGADLDEKVAENKNWKTR